MSMHKLPVPLPDVGQELARARRETGEALDRQAATAEILKVIASSPDNVQPVFDAIVASAKRLFVARASIVTRMIDGRLQIAALTETSAAGHEILQRIFSKPLAPSNPHAMAVNSGKPFYRSDIESDPGMSAEEKDVARARGYRSLLVVPMLRDGAVIGTLAVSRPEAGTFSGHQINLLETFADQALIAIENVRLFNVTKEALDQQKQMMRRFATSEVADDLQQSGFALGGRRVRGTVMFSDIRGFTALVESLLADETIGLLNTYYRLMFDAISGHGGVVNQMIGDGLMAIFGAPLPLPEPSLAAVRAALDMARMIDVYNLERVGLGKAPIRIGIGIATGEMVAGYTGTLQRATYTCIGDTVNLAARLEAHTKEAGHGILVDGDTQAALAGRVRTLPLGEVLFKGKTVAVPVFAVKPGS